MTLIFVGVDFNICLIKTNRHNFISVNK